ncbi:DUF659 domain-containing protein [Mycena indigotica]|uniref:DUF659 domain-containing protein n=1 Tax=Mycena indigotica TaxID=2126181 RepID=A0A8H6SR20_9AGAR|nr:DUF659 domain-containing protein [Mycena indigotica]KAF7303480.1 DUF659 domain-containing protein [Mycena indigotica]
MSTSRGKSGAKARTGARQPPITAALLGALHYGPEIRNLAALLKSLPSSIPLGTAHDFSSHELRQEAVMELGCEKSVVNQDLEWSFGSRVDGKLIEFQSRGPGLEAVTVVLRQYITGPAGQNVVLIKWVDDLTAAAQDAIERCGAQKRKRKSTAARQRMEEDEDEENVDKRQRLDTENDKQQREMVAEAAAKLTRQGSINHPFDDLIDIPPPQRSKRGRAADPTLEELTIPCETKSLNPKTGKPYKRFRCAGPGCHESWAEPRQAGRVFPHAAKCPYFSAEQRNMAAVANAKNALSNDVSSSDDDGGNATAKDENEAKAGMSKNPYFDPFRGLGEDERKKAIAKFQKKANLYLLEFLAVTGRALRHVDENSFKKLVKHLNPYHGLFSSTTMADYVHREAAKITMKNSTRLRTIGNLTMSYDGATVFGQSIYSGHVTTPKLRESFLMLADESSGDSHTGEHIKDILLGVIDDIGPLQFAALVSDDAGNTRVARELIAEKYPTIIALADAPHHLSNLVKDICKLAHFEEGIEKMRTVIGFFSTSTYAGTHLKALRVIMDITKGLVTVGKTRFGTMYWSGYALLRNLPAIHELIRLGVVRAEGSEEQSKLGFFRKVPLYNAFKLNLEQLVTILEPIARAIQCLEGSMTTLGDVWKFYVAITAVLQDNFAENALAIPDDVMDAIRRIVNARYQQLIGSTDAYLAGFFLDPQYVTSTVLKRSSGNLLVSSPTESSSATPGNQAAEDGDADLRRKMPAYAAVGTFLVNQLKAELKARPNLKSSKVFSPYADRKAVIAALRSQLEAFTRQRAPFNRRNAAWTRAYLYWRALLDDADASVLAYIALKIFSIMPTSMPEERTVSVFTKLSTKDRNRQDAKTTVALTQVRQEVCRRDGERKPAVQPHLNWRSVKAAFATAEAVEPALPPVASGSGSDLPVIDLSAENEPSPNIRVSEDGVNDAVAAGLHALNTRSLASDVLADIALLPSFESTRFEAEDSADISDAFFRDLLSDAPVAGAEKAVGSGVIGGKGKEKATPAAVFDDDIDDEVF